MIPTKFRFIWLGGYRGEYFLEINQSETRIACGGPVCLRIGTKLAFFIKDFTRMFPTNFLFTTSFGQAASEEKIFLEINQSDTRIACGGHVC
jgi:hypothetical protein